MKKYIFGGIVLVVAGLLLGFVLFGSVKAPVSIPVEQAPLGDVNTNSTLSFNSPVCHASSGTSICEDWAGGKIIAQRNQAYWKNTTGMTQYVDLADVSTDGNASSTFKIYAVSTSSPLANIYDFTAPAATTSNLINGFSFATSSAATTTSNMESSFAGRVVRVPAGSEVNIYLQSNDGGLCNPKASKCETATSTNRGFNLFWRLHYHN